MIKFIVTLVKAGYIVSRYFFTVILFLAGRVCCWGLTLVKESQRERLRLHSCTVLALLQRCLRYLRATVRRVISYLPRSIRRRLSMLRNIGSHGAVYHEEDLPIITVTDEDFELVILNLNTNPAASSPVSSMTTHPTTQIKSADPSQLTRAPPFRPRKSRSLILPSFHSPIPKIMRSASFTHSRATSQEVSSPTPPQLILGPLSNSPTPISSPMPPSATFTLRSLATPTIHSSSTFRASKPTLPTFGQQPRCHRLASGSSAHTTASANTILGMGSFPPDMSCASSIANLCMGMEMQLMSSQVELEDWRGRVAREAGVVLD